ncbi:MAG: hypothetical protein ACFBZ8_06465 [Opitutales bacterium]
MQKPRLRWIGYSGLVGIFLSTLGCGSGPHAHLHVPPGAPTPVEQTASTSALTVFYNEVPPGFSGELRGIVSQAYPQAKDGLEAFETEVARQARQNGAEAILILTPEPIFDVEGDTRPSFGNQLTLYRAELYSIGGS